MKRLSFTHLELHCMRIHLNQCTYRSIGPSMLTSNQHDTYAQAQSTRSVTEDSGFGKQSVKQPVNQGFYIAKTETNGVAQTGDRGRI